MRSYVHREPTAIDGTNFMSLNYDHIFSQAIDRLHEEGRYRVFIDILRNKGAYPNARCFAHHNGPQPITVWCSNDYLGMGQHPKVVAAMEEALHDVGAGSGGMRASRMAASVSAVSPDWLMAMHRVRSSMTGLA